MNGLQFACLHGFFHNHVHDFVVNFNNFSSEGFPLSVNLPILNIHGLMEDVAEGMIFNGNCPNPERWRLQDLEIDHGAAWVAATTLLRGMTTTGPHRLELSKPTTIVN